MAEVGSKRVDIAALNDKRQVMSTLAITMSPTTGSLPRQDRKVPTFPEEYNIWHILNHWANGDTAVILPYVQKIKK